MHERIIFHIDINHCYAQIEEMLYPDLRRVPMAVGGHEEKRHGIILTKNDLAKKEGILTGESLRDAYEKDPDLLIIPPHYDTYIYYTNEVKKIYYQYSDHVESFGLDEAWIDYTDSVKLFGDPVETAHEIQDRVLQELGLTVSVGVSWNKAFAKLGSDMKKPSGFTVITPQNYQSLVWPLPCEDLIYVGPATTRKLHERGIRTIGELACYPVRYLKKAMGVSGEMVHAFANGLDPSPVAETNAVSVPKSIGNSMTLIHDVDNFEDLKAVYGVLSEAVAGRMKEEGVIGSTLNLFFRGADMQWYGCERKMQAATDISEDLFQEVLPYLSLYDFHSPVRAAGLGVSHLRPDPGMRQLDLFVDEDAHDKARRTDLALEEIRSRYGFHAVRKASTMVDEELTDFNVRADHTVHPVGYFQGRKMRV